VLCLLILLLGMFPSVSTLDCIFETPGSGGGGGVPGLPLPLLPFRDPQADHKICRDVTNVSTIWDIRTYDRCSIPSRTAHFAAGKTKSSDCPVLIVYRHCLSWFSWILSVALSRRRGRLRAFHLISCRTIRCYMQSRTVTVTHYKAAETRPCVLYSS
jgi:hypothetical protein